eukprot:jgi/Orpsp1_1/1177607/evm.model.c7180000062121.1
MIPLFFHTNPFIFENHSSLLGHSLLWDDCDNDWFMRSIRHFNDDVNDYDDYSDDDDYDDEDRVMNDGIREVENYFFHPIILPTSARREREYLKERMHDRLHNHSTKKCEEKKENEGNNGNSEGENNKNKNGNKFGENEHAPHFITMSRPRYIFRHYRSSPYQALGKHLRKELLRHHQFIEAKKNMNMKKKNTTTKGNENNIEKKVDEKEKKNENMKKEKQMMNEQEMIQEKVQEKVQENVQENNKEQIEKKQKKEQEQEQEQQEQEQVVMQDQIQKKEEKVQKQQQQEEKCKEQVLEQKKEEEKGENKEATKEASKESKEVTKGQEQGQKQDLFQTIFNNSCSVFEEFYPKVNISEDEHHVYLHADLPGMTKEQVKMEISEEGLLTLSGKRETLIRKGKKDKDGKENEANNEEATKEEKMDIDDDEEEKEEDEDKEKYSMMECSYGEFERTLTLPEEVDTKPEHISAKMENGVLEVVFNKLPSNKKKEQIRTIQIQ